MYIEILDKKRLEILPKLAKFKNSFYLAGGTALALQLGHRQSIDFDFFSLEDIDCEKLFSELTFEFPGYKIKKVQEEKNTLSIIIDNEIKISFFTYKYPMVSAFVETDYLRLANLSDIACMKLSAIVGRATNKDYIDIYYLLKEKISLSEIIKKTENKLPDLDISLVLKSLVYFDDIEIEPIMFIPGKEVEFNEIKNYIISEVKKYNNI